VNSRKVFLSVCSFFLCLNLNAKDFSSSCSAGKVWVDFENCTEKLLRSEPGFVRGKNVTVKGHYSSESSWKHNYTDGPSYDEKTGRFYFKVGFKKKISSKWKNNASVSGTVFIDNSLPEIYFDGLENVQNKNGAWCSSFPVSFRAVIPPDVSDFSETGCGLSAVKYSVDGGSYTEVSFDSDGETPYSFEFENEGTHSISFYLKDKLGNERKSVFNFVIDVKPPEITLKTLHDETKWSRECIVAAEAFDEDSGIDEDSWCYSLDGGLTWSEKAAGNNTVSVKKEGINLVKFKVSDNASNENQNAVPVKVMIDRSAPKIFFEDYSVFSTWNSKDSIKIKPKAVDELSAVEISSWKYSSDGAQIWKACSSGGSVEISEEGKTALIFSVEDNAGNIAISDEVEVFIDRTPGNIIVENPFAGKWISKGAVSAVMHDDNSGCNDCSWKFSLDGGKTWSLSSRENSSVDFSRNGIYQLVFAAEDNAGNESYSDIHEIKVDTTGCKFYTDFDFDRVYSSANNISVKFSAENNISGIDAEKFFIIFDDEKISLKKNEFLIVPETGNGIHQIKFGAVTNAGVLCESEVFTFENDASSPELFLEVEPDEEQVRIKMCFSDSESGIKSAAYSLNGEDSVPVRLTDCSVRDGKYVYEILLPVGEKIDFTGSCCDCAGNKKFSYVNAVYPVPEVDIEVTAENNCDWAKKNILRAFSTSDIIDESTWRHEVFLNDSFRKSAPGNTLVLDEHGSYDVVFSVNDKKGNKYFSQKTSLLIDCRGPVFENNYVLWENTLSVCIKDDESGLNESSVCYSLDDGATFFYGSTVELDDCKKIPVLFKASDNAGNESIKKYLVDVDTTPPELYWSDIILFKNNILKIKDFTCADKVSGISAVKAAVDDKYFFDINEALFNKNRPYVEIVLEEKLTSGNHILKVSAEDNFGNICERTSEFYCDLIPPVIKGAVFSCGDEILKENSFVPVYKLNHCGEITVDVDAVDFYDDSGDTSLKNYSYIEICVSDENVFNEDNSSVFYPDEKIIINGKKISFFEGKNYVLIKAFDDCGNESELYSTVFYGDPVVPGKAFLTSVTHKKAVCNSDSAAKSSAVFSVFPSCSGDGGIKGFNISIYDCVFSGSGYNILDAVREEYFLEERFSECFTVDSLPDSKKDHCYLLCAAAAGNNGLTGEPAYYPFRIDTGVPEKLTLESFPCFGETYTNEEDIILDWNVPDDSSGIREFEIALFDKNNVQIASKTFNGNTRSCILKVSSFVNKLDDGKVVLRLTAADYAGNKTYDEGVLYFDFDSPVLKDELTVMEEDGKCAFKWKRPYDLGSGLCRVELLIESIDEKDFYRNITLLPDAESYVLSDIPGNGAFYVQLSVSDFAGNRACVEKKFTCGTGSIPEVYEKNFSEEVRGFTLSGTMIINEKKSTACGKDMLLGFSGDNGFYVSEDGSLKEKENFYLKDMLFENSLKYYGSLKSRSRGDYIWKNECICVSFNDYEFSDSGMLLLKPELEFLNDGFKLPFDSVLFSDIRNTLLYSSVQNDRVSLSKHGFSFEGIEFYSLSGRYVEFSGANSKGIRVKSDRVNLFNEDGSDYTLKETLSLSVLTDEMIADVKNAVVLLNDQKIYILDGRIKNDRFFIFDSYLKVNESVCSSEKDASRLILRNYYIDSLTGEVCTGTDFYASKVSADGGKYFSSVKFNSSGCLLTDGNIDLGVYGHSVHAEGFIITADGFSLDSGVPVPPFETTLFGFRIFCDEVVYGSECLLVKKGRALIQEKEVNFSNLGLYVTKKDYVCRECSLGDVTLYFDSYGGNGQLKNLSITKKGFISVMMYLDGPEGNDPLIFDFVQLYGDGSVKASSCYEQMLVFGKTIIYADEADFNGKKIVLINPEINLPSGFTIESVQVKKIECDAGGIISDIKISKDITYLFSGWKIYFESLSLSSKGFYGKSRIEGNGKRKNTFWNVLFPKIYVGFNGEIDGESEFDNSDSFFVYSGYKLNIEGTYFIQEKENLWNVKCKSPEVIFPGFKVAIGMLEFSSDGNLVSSQEGGESYECVTPQGISVLPEKAFFSDGLLNFTGSIKAEFLGDYIPLDGKVLQFTESGFIGGEKIEREFGFTFDNQHIKSRSLKIDGLKLTLGDSEVSYNGEGIELGNIALFSDGRICDSTCVMQNRSIIINGVESILYRAGIDSEGIKLGVKYLADTFFVAAICFENARFTEDGGIFSDYVYDELVYDAAFGQVKLKNLRLGRKGVEAEELSLIFSSLDDACISVHGVSFDRNGNFTLKGLESSVFELWNMSFCIKNVSYKNSKFSFSGTVILPSDLPGILAGKRINLKEFIITKNGNIEKFEATLNQKIVFNIFDKWNVETQNLKLDINDEHAWIVFGSARLRFPPGFALASIGVKGLRFDLKNMDYDLDNVFVESESEVEYCGIRFKLDKVTLGDGIIFKGSARFISEKFPPFLKNKSFRVNSFQIKKDGSFGDIDMEIQGLSGKIAEGVTALELYDGRIGFANSRESGLELCIGGDLVFTQNAPDFLRGTRLSVKEFVIDLKSRSIKKLSASYAQEKNVSFYFSGCELKNLSASFDLKNTFSESFIDLGCVLVFPGSLPACDLINQVKVNTFRIGMDGSILAFNFKAQIEKMECEALELFDCVLSAEYADQLVFNLNSRAKLSEEKFPRGIGGLTASVMMKFNSHELLDASGEFSLGSRIVFDAVEIRNGKISFEKKKGRSAVLKAGGTVSLGNSFPESLRGLSMDITELSFNMNGEILYMDIGASELDFYIFPSVHLCDGFLKFIKSGKNDSFITAGGDIVLEGKNIPDGLKGIRIEIDEFLMDSSGNVKCFSAGLCSSVRFSLLGGMDFVLESLVFDKDGFDIGASVSLNIPLFVVKDAGFVLNKLRMDWNGNIKEFSGGIKHCEILLAGFSGEISELCIQNESGYRIGLEECMLKLPENFGSIGGKKLGVKDAYFDPVTMDFHGDFSIDSVTTEIAGFTLNCNDPVINMTSMKIQFSSVELIMPDFLGKASLKLDGVYISSTNGLRFSGGKFSLPDFSIGQAGFKNIGAAFSVDENGRYYISGSGGIIIPNAGEISASLSFTNVCREYPVGIRHAYFSYESYVTGIPLGTTGLCLCGIRGGFGFGYPEEVPEKYRNIFGNNGKRLELGLTVRDQETMGSLAVIKADCWIDITKIAWVFEGNATILSGTLDISASAVAVLKSNAFATGMQIRILFISGKFEFYIFDLNGKVKFSGKGSVGIRIPKGFLVDSFLLTLPSHDMWLLETGTMFGDFTNGKRGFLGYIELNLCGCRLGRIGAFIGSGGLSLDVKNYEILRPEGISFNKRGVKGTNGSLPLKNRILSFENNKANERSVYIEKGDRLMFAAGYAAAVPDFEIISPSGLVYTRLSKEIEYSYFDKGLLVAADSDETGYWTMKLLGVQDGTYEVVAFGAEKIPEVSFDSSDTGVIAIDGGFTVTGHVEGECTGVEIFSGKNLSSPQFSLGECKCHEDGKFEFELDEKMFEDGEFCIFARAQRKNGFPGTECPAPWKVRVDRSLKSMAAPEEVLISMSMEGKLVFSWKGMNGKRDMGFYMYSRNKKTGSVMKDNLGNIRFLTLDGAYAEDYEFAFSSYDSNGIESPKTDFESYLPYQPGDVLRNNLISSFDEEIYCSIESGECRNVSLAFCVESFMKKGSVQDFVRAGVINETSVENIHISFEEKYEINDSDNNITFSVYADPSCIDSEKEIHLYLYNMAYPDDVKSIRLHVTVKLPSIDITGVFPSVIDGSVSNRVCVTGTGFMHGVTFYFDGSEVPVSVEDVCNNVSCSLTLPSVRENGIHVLSAVNAAGEKSEIPVTVNLPYYSLVIYSMEEKCCAGEKSFFPVTAVGFCGYDEDIGIYQKNTVEGINVEIPAIHSGDTACITVSVEKNCAPGVYTLDFITDNDFEFSVSVSVSASTVRETEYNLCRINAMSSLCGFPGACVTVYGNNFGKNGSLFIAGKKIKVKKWTDSFIEFIIPDFKEQVTDSLVVKTKKNGSAEISFTVLSAMFGIEIEKNEVVLEEEQNCMLKLSAFGQSPRIELSIDYDETWPFKVYLDDSVIAGGGRTNLHIVPGEELFNGVFDISVKAYNGLFFSEKTVKVKILNVVEIESEDVLSVTAGAYFERKMKLTGFEKGIWTLEANYAGDGIVLSETGILSGKIEEAGEYYIIITANNEKKVYRKRVEIKAFEDTWNGRHKNPLRNIRSYCDVPALEQKLWHKKFDKNISYILAASGCECVVFDDSFQVLDVNGDVLWNAEDLASDVFMTSDKVVYISGDKSLKIRDLQTGYVLYVRENAKDFFCTDELLSVCEEGGVAEISLSLLKLTGFNKEEVFDSSVAVQYGGKILFAEGNCILDCNRKVLFKAENRIMTLAADSRYLFAVTKNRIYVTDESGIPVFEIDCYTDEKTLVASDEEKMYVSSENGLTVYNLRNGELISVLSRNGNYIIANEKIVLYDDNGLFVFNPYSLKEIWKASGCFDSVCIYCSKIYASSGTELTCFSGQANVNSPEVSIIFDMNEPDGNNGWYRSLPHVSVDFSDAETFVVQKNVAVNSISQENMDCLLLNDGENRIEAWGTDSGNLRSVPVLKKVFIDREKPETELYLTSGECKNGWYNESVVLGIRAEDGISGVAGSFLNGRIYERPLVIEEDGIHNIEIYSVDNAGNFSEKRNYVLKLDHNPPYVDAAVIAHEGLSLVKMNAFDAVSGVKKIEYRINGGEVMKYDNPVPVFNSPSDVFLEYRAFDESGLVSQWQKINIPGKPVLSGRCIVFAEINESERKIMKSLTPGCRLYDSTSAENFIIDFPEEMSLSEYVLLDESDIKNENEKNLELYVQKNCRVFLLTADEDLYEEQKGEWSVIRENFETGSSYFGGKTILYERKVSAGEKVEIKFTDKLPLVAVIPDENS